MQSQKHINIPIFIPEKSCPFKCIYCNQQKITGVKALPEVNDIKNIIKNHLKTIDGVNSQVEIAFFGGNFTGIPLSEQVMLLSSVQEYIQKKQVSSIRVSTRPDYINRKVLKLLKKFNVHTIELGIQSIDNDVLKASGRGYNSERVKEAASLIKEFGFELCLQMMIGLPDDTLEKSLCTAQAIISCGATMTRIYPLLVIKDTSLEDLYYKGLYKPLSLEEAVFWSREVFKVFLSVGIKVLKIGLHPSEDLMYGEAVIAGPFHPSFAELVFTSLWQEKFTSIKSDSSKSLTVFVNARDYNHAIGYEAQNKKILTLIFKKVKFEIDNKLNRFEFYVDYS